MRKTFVWFASQLTSGSRGRHMMVKPVSLGILLAGVLIAGAVRAVADAPTPVTCGSAITAPGQYVLAGDCMGAGITITASDVHLKLMGHTMTAQPIGFFMGILVIPNFPSATSVSHVHIEGPGTITKYNFGIFFQTVSDSHVEQVSCTENIVGSELHQSTDTHVNNNVFSMNVTGLAVAGSSSDNHVNDNQAIGNISQGIGVEMGSTGNHINGNTALGNGPGNDLNDDNANCDNNTWNGNTFVTANQPCIH